MNMDNVDYIGPPKKRFNWKRLKFAWGNWHYETDSFGDTINKCFVWEPKKKRNINDYSGEERPPPKMMLQPIPEKYRTWIHKNVKELNLNYAHSYCQLMIMSFPDLNIVEGAMLFDRGDIRNKSGKFVYCTDQNGLAINPLYQAFDTIYDYRTIRTIVKAAVSTEY